MISKEIKKIISILLVISMMMNLFACGTTISIQKETVETITEKKVEETSETAEPSKARSDVKGDYNYVPASKYEIEGDVCYVLDYTGGVLPVKPFGDFKKFDFSRNQKTKIKSMRGMFGYIYEPDTEENTWGPEDVEEVNFTGLDTSECTDMSYLFNERTALKKVNFGNIDTKNVVNMYKIFCECNELEEISGFDIDTQNVENMRGAFFKCLKLKDLNFKSLNSKKVNDISYAFYKTGFENIDLSNMDTKNVTNLSYLFGNCRELKSVNVSKLNTENVINMSYMFLNCKSIKNLDVSSFNTQNVYNMLNIFAGMESLESIDVSNFNTSNVNSFSYMFDRCKKIEELNLKSFDTSNANSFDHMFSNMEKIKNLDISNFKFENKVKKLAPDLSIPANSPISSNLPHLYITSMFANCYELESIDISNLDISKTENKIGNVFVFDACGKLKNVKLKSDLEKNDSYNNIMSQLDFIKDTEKNKRYSDRKSKLYNKDLMQATIDSWHQLVENEFTVVATDHGIKEFFNIYEDNRYQTFPNFVTTDSLLHTYHLYFDHLMKEIEKDKLLRSINNISRKMEDVAKKYYAELKGTDYEAHAKSLMAFFAVPLKIFDENYIVDDAIKDIVDAEIKKINDHSESHSIKPIFGEHVNDEVLANIEKYKKDANLYMDDYTQYKPRGHYDGDPDLEKYFKVLMWYGRVNFSSREKDLTKIALLMSYALNEIKENDSYNNIKDIIYYFAGFSDDNGPIEYYDVAKKSFGDTFNKDALIDNNKYENFLNGLKTLKVSLINSQPEVYDIAEELKDVSFRFIGQTYTYDAEMFKWLIFDYVKKLVAGEKRYLPDFLDVPASLGSETATKILMEEGNDKFIGYTENLKKMQNEMPKKIDSDNKEILYLKWMKVLKSLIDSDKNNSAFPSFMKGEEWRKKKLETFGGSYAELKHDTILYAKQTYGAAEMGEGGYDEFYDYEEIVYDDKGYVEPEAAVYYLLAEMALSMKVKFANMLNEKGIEFLDNFSTLSSRLSEISMKELQGQALSADDYELIRSYGGNIEHLIVDSGAYSYDPIYQKSNAIVADIATGELGGGYYAREIATGNPLKVYVLVEVDGKYKVCSGGVFDFYQFEVPAQDRMTDIEWRTAMGFDDNLLNAGESPVDDPWSMAANEVKSKIFTVGAKKDFTFQTWTNSYRDFNGVGNDSGSRIIYYLGGNY